MTHFTVSSTSRPSKCCVDRWFPARGRTVRRWRQGQAVDKRCGVGTSGRVEVGVLIQTGRVPREGAVETGALKVSVVKLAGGRRGGRGGRAGAWAEGGVLRLWWRRSGGGGAAVVTRAHLLCFDLRFVVSVLTGLMSARRRWRYSSGSPTRSFGSPRGAAVGVRVHAG